MTKYTKPGTGWIVVLCAYFALAGLLIWGQGSPEGEPLLEIENSLRQGILPQKMQRQQLFKALEHNLQWVQAWQGQQTRLLGSAWPQRSEASEILIWRHQNAALKLKISSVQAASKLPAHVQLAGYSAQSNWQKQIQLPATGLIELPASTASPELLKVSLKQAARMQWELLP